MTTKAALSVAAVLAPPTQLYRWQMRQGIEALTARLCTEGVLSQTTAAIHTDEINAKLIKSLGERPRFDEDLRQWLYQQCERSDSARNLDEQLALDHCFKTVLPQLKLRLEGWNVPAASAMHGFEGPRLPLLLRDEQDKSLVGCDLISRVDLDDDFAYGLVAKSVACQESRGEPIARALVIRIRGKSCSLLSVDKKFENLKSVFLTKLAMIKLMDSKGKIAVV